jgi:nucleolar protein 56
VKIAPCAYLIVYLTCVPTTDTPTPKFGEALRQQVEERLTFFETGAPPGKNSDAIRKVIDQLALEKDDSDEDMADAEPILPLIEAEPPKKKDKKKKKRKADEMELDSDEDEDGGDGEPVKKVKLSKEEKKALKKKKKLELKLEAAEVSDIALSCTLPERIIPAYHQDTSPKKEKKDKKEKEKEKRKKEKKAKP